MHRQLIDSVCFWVTSHHDITTQPQLLSYHIIKFIDHIFEFHLNSFRPQSIPFIAFRAQPPSHSFQLLKFISFRFTIFDYTQITQSFNPNVISTFQPISSLEINNILGVSLDKFQFYKIIHHLKLNFGVSLYSLAYVS